MLLRVTTACKINKFKIVNCEQLRTELYLWYAWIGKKQVRLALERLPKASKSRTTTAMGSSSSSYTCWGENISLVLISEYVINVGVLNANYSPTVMFHGLWRVNYTGFYLPSSQCQQ